MIKFTDTALLAFTKLRSRKIRTIITVLLASLLFGVLIAASLVMTGAFRSVESFREDGLTSRYIVSVYPNISSDSNTLYKLRRDPQAIAEAKKRYEKLVEEKKAEAEKLGLPYTQASDQPPYTQQPDGTEVLAMSDRNGIVNGLTKEYFADKPSIDDVKLKEVSQRYHAKDIFSSRYLQTLRGSTLDVLPNGKEVFYDQADEAERNANYIAPIINKDMMILAPPEITTPFMLPNNAGWKPDEISIPIILPQNAVERLLNKDTTATDKMSAVDKLAYLRQLRADAANLTVQACYRNDASNALIQQTVQQQKDIKANEGKDDYEKPSVIYKLPDATKCEDPSIASDTRTDEQKKQDENQDLFDRKFSDKTDPESYFVTFKVVGISPAQTSGLGSNQLKEQASNIGDILDSLLKTEGVGQVIPRSLYDQLDSTAKGKYANLFTFTPIYAIGNVDDLARYVEFSNAQDAQKFIDEQSCTTQMDGVCKPIDRDYQLSLSFTNSAALDDIQSKAQEWFRYAMLAVIILAAVIMWITIGRAIADGRHETAVFRAIGFKRGDIAAVYILYTVLLSVLVAVFATGIGYLGAYITNQQLAPSLTTQAQYGFGGIDMTKEVNLIGFDQQQLMLILMACLATGLLSMIIPLIGNVRRSPIRDMREE